MVIEDVKIRTDQQIGGGAFGHVFKGIFNDRECAVKVLHATSMELKTGLPTGSHVQLSALEKFKLECKHLQEMKHDNIVCHLATRMIEKGDSQIPVLVMELLDCSLRRFLDEELHIKQFIQVSVSLNVASALNFLHHEDRKLVHRDLCGDNILLSTNGPWPVAKISDFGMSRIIDLETLSRSLSAIGHRNGYLPPMASLMSPDDRYSYDTSLDIFMFGAVMTQIAKKVPHIESETQRKQLVASIESSHPLREWIIKCLQEKGERPTAGEIQRQLSRKIKDLMM